MPVANRVPGTVTRWSPSALILGGGGILGLSVAGTLDVTGIASSPVWLHTLFLLGGLWLVFVGLVGFSPRLAEQAPRLSLVGTLTSALGVTALTIGLTASLAVSLTSDVPFGEGPSWGPPLLVAAFVLGLLSFLVYGAASVLVQQPSQRMGFLLLVPVAGFFGQAVLLASKIATGEALAALQLALGAASGTAIIAVGYLLRTDYAVRPETESRADTTP